MNILIAAVPVPELTEFLNTRSADKPVLFVTESRPFESLVAEQLEHLKQNRFETVLLTDNMIGALMQQKHIDEVWGLFFRKEGENALVPAVSYTAARMARMHDIPFYLFEHQPLSVVEKGLFAGKDITVNGAGYRELAVESLAIEQVKEVVYCEN